MTGLIEELVRNVLNCDHRSIAKAMTFVENEPEKAKEIVRLIHPHTGKAHVIGFTGPPGSGKSTLIGKVVKELRNRGKTVGVVVIDPTSPFTGGAFLGDRIRMQELSVDRGVFIRSMATRDGFGGIAKATEEAVMILDAAGKDVVITETTGAGQSEVEIGKIAQTVVVVLAPGMGNEIQAIKAGMMEIGDIFVVNKADKENVEKTVLDIENILRLGMKRGRWKPPVIKTIALSGEGVSELLEKVNSHKQLLETRMMNAKLKQKLETELIEAIKEKVVEFVIKDLKRGEDLDQLIQEISNKKIDLYSAAEKLAKKITRTWG